VYESPPIAAVSPSPPIPYASTWSERLAPRVESLTGIPGFDWVLAQLYAVSGALVLGSPWWRSPGARVRGVLVLPFVVGAAGIAVLAVAFSADTRAFLGLVADGAGALLVAALVVLAGAAVADFLVSRGARLVVATRVFRRSSLEADAALTVALLVPATLGLVGLVRLDERTSSADELSRTITSGQVTIEAEYELPGQPMDVALRTSSEGYVSFGDGRIARFVLGDATGEIELTVEVTGLESPRGLAIVGDSLVLAELGRLPCDQSFPCKGENVAGAASVEEGERRILRESNGRLLRFDIGTDGTLANRRVILNRLPVANTDHGVNAVTAGPDGRVYVTIGNLDRLAATPLTTLDRSRPNFDLLGVVLSLQPDGADVRVFARGLRNVYDLAFDDHGRLYGVDNDGETRSGWRREEVLEIRQGAHYGYPFDGTFGPHTRRTAPPLWLVDTAGSAGVEWLRASGLPTLVVGSCDDVHAVELAEADGAVTVSDRTAVRHLLSVPGCVTAVERVSAERVLLTLFTFGGPPRLYVVRLSS